VAEQIGPTHRVLLLGFERALHAQLAKILSQQNHAVWAQPFSSRSRSIEASLGKLEKTPADVICCPADPETYPLVIAAVKQRHPQVPVVVVSTDPNTSEWLDAIEGGAWDYFGLPFEAAHILHVLENAVKCADRDDMN
jgi:DNA-binding NtrC family response regulator